MTNSPRKTPRLPLPTYPVDELPPGTRTIHGSVRRLIVVESCIGAGTLEDPARQAVFFYTFAGRCVGFHDPLQSRPVGKPRELAELRKRVAVLELERQELEQLLAINGPREQPGELHSQVGLCAAMARRLEDLEASFCGPSGGVTVAGVPVSEAREAVKAMCPDGQGPAPTALVIDGCTTPVNLELSEPTAEDDQAPSPTETPAG